MPDTHHCAGFPCAQWTWTQVSTSVQRTLYWRNCLPKPGLWIGVSFYNPGSLRLIIHLSQSLEPLEDRCSLPLLSSGKRKSWHQCVLCAGQLLGLEDREASGDFLSRPSESPTPVLPHRVSTLLSAPSPPNTKSRTSWRQTGRKTETQCGFWSLFLA